MRWDREAWSDRLEGFDYLGRGIELAVAIIVITGLAVGGGAALVGIAFVPSVLVGASVAAVGLALHWVRSRRRGTTFLADD